MTEYNVRLEYQMKPDADAGDMLIETFKHFHPGVGSAGENTDVWLTLQGVDAYDVTRMATAIAAEVNRPLIALEVLPTAAFDEREARTPMPELVGADEAADLLGISRQAIGKQYATGALPGKRVGERTLVFARRDVDAAVSKAVSIGFRRWVGEADPEVASAITGPMYEALALVGVLPAYNAYLAVQRGEVSQSSLAEAWREAVVGAVVRARAAGLTWVVADDITAGRLR